MPNVSSLHTRTRWLAVAIALLAAVPFFYDLGAFPIFQWDEARYVNNALEMRAHGDPLIISMDGQIDTWNFKPPLVLWLQVGSMALFGPSEWAVRLPSALAGVGLAVLIFWFGATVLRTRLAGLCSALVFLGCWGFLSPHTGRTADLDAVQAFFLVLYGFLYLRYLADGGRPARVFPVLGALVVAAFLCKGMPGFFFLPFLAIITLLHGNWRRVLNQRILYVTAVAVAALCAGYYALRDYQSPGYWQLLKASEFNRFSGKGVEWHVQPFGFYWNNFIELKRFYPLVWYLPLVPTVFLTARTRRMRRFCLYVLLLAVGYFFFISWPPVKLAWYDAPLYPLLAVLLGTAISEGSAWLLRRVNRDQLAWRVSIGLILVLALCWPAYRYIAGQVRYDPDKLSDWESEGAVLRGLHTERPGIRHLTVVRHVKNDVHYDQIKFYQKTWRERYGCDIVLKRSASEVNAGDTVLVSRQEARAELEQAFQFRVLYTHRWGSVGVVGH